MRLNAVALRGSCALIALTTSSLGWAQDASSGVSATPPSTMPTPNAETAPATASSQPAPTQNGQLGEIVVTANKRAENINRVGLTVTAISGDQLAARRITSVQDIAAAVPGLNFAQSGTSTPIYTLRGVGFNETTLGVFPAVSVYLDEVPLQFPVLTLHSAYDLERIEALKGPQGTLFGENSTGGAINYIAAKPSNTPHAGVDASYGRFNEFDGNAYITGPITDNLAARLAVTGERADGWQRSYTRPGDRNGAISYFAGRFLAAWDPTNRLHIAFNVNGWVDKSEPQAPQLIAIRPQQPQNVHGSVLNYPFSPFNSRDADWTPGANAPSSDRKFFQVSVRGDYKLTDEVTLTSLTSYNHLTQKLSTDEDGMATLVANLSPSDGKIHTLNQELRLAGTMTGFRWVVGGNYEKDYTFENQTLNFGDGSSSNASTLFIDTTGSLNTAHIRNLAGFGNVEYDIAPRLTIKGGVRYTDSRNHTALCGYANGDGNVAALFNLLGSLLGTVPFTPIPNGGCYVLNDNFVPGDTFYSTLHQHNVSWKGGLDYRLNSTTLLYANVSRGYKAGSYPTLSASTFAQYQPVTQESVTAYEAGFKAGFFDRKAQLNAAAFYYDYKNKQIRGKIVDPIFNVLDILINIPKSRVYGAEADLTVRPVSNLTLQGAVTYLNSRVQRYTGPTIYGDTQDFSGDALPFTPKFGYSASADYRIELAGGGHPFIGVSVRGQTKSVSTLGGDDIDFLTGPSYRNVGGIGRPFRIPGYAVVDGRAGYEFPGQRLSVSVWGKNIFNKYYITNSAQFLDATVRYTGLPATYGVTGSLKF